MKKKSELIVVDIETFYSYFCVVNYDVNTKQYVNFEICREVNDLALMKKYYGALKKTDYLVTFNGLDFDWPILDWILNQKTVSAKMIYKYTQKIIQAPVKDKWKYRPKFNKIGQIDLFKLNHYDRFGISLKYLQFTTNWKKMQDLPYHHGDDLSRIQEKEVLLYCVNDVDSTYHFFKECKDKIALRFKLSKAYSKNMVNLPDAQMGESIVLHKYADAVGKDPKELSKLRTHRDIVHIKDIIFKYVNFKTAEFNTVLTQFKNIIIDSVNSEFKIEQSFRSTQYDFGLGGIHSSKIGVFDEDDEYIIRDWDVKMVASKTA